MTNKIQEQCSCLIDGELKESECCVVLDEISDNPELKQDLHRYYLIRDAIRTNLPGVINTNFSQSVMDALESEPTILAPTFNTDTAKESSLESSARKDNILSHARFYKRAASFAIAASVATIAVFTFSSTNTVEQATSELAQMPDSSEFIRLSKSKSVAPKTMDMRSPEPHLTENVLVSQPLSSIPLTAKSPISNNDHQISNYDHQIQRYIINHNQQISSSRLQSVMPYARIVVTKTNKQIQVQDQAQQ